MRSHALAGGALIASFLAVPPLSAQGSEPTCPAKARAAAQGGGDPACPGVRPGAAAFNAKEGVKSIGCTIGFLLRGSDGARYALVGHPCAPDSAPATVGVGNLHDEVMWRPGRGPAIVDSTAKPVGRLVYDIRWKDADRDLDFALMRLESRTPYSSKVCVFGGPSRINADVSPDPILVQTYGQGDQFTVTGPNDHEDLAPRGLDNPAKVHTVSSTEYASAGAPVLAGDGSQALGILSQGNEIGGGATIFRLGPILDLLRQRLHVRFTLVRAGER